MKASAENYAKLLNVAFGIGCLVLGMGCVILLWHSLGLPYNYFE